MKHYFGLILLLTIYLLLAFAHSWVIPLSKGPDEYDNFLYIQFIATHHRLPMTVAERRSIGVKADWPPLYQLFIGTLTSWIEPTPSPRLKLSGDSPTRQLIDLVLPRGATVVRTADERWPLRGVYLAWFMGRWLTILLSAGTVALTWAMARTIFPDNPSLALAAGALLAFTPRFQYMSAVLNDDNLQGFLSALFLLFLIKWVKSPHSTWLPVSLGILLGLTMVVKYSVAFVPFGLVIVGGMLKWQYHWSWERYVKTLAIIGFFALLASSWWLLWVAWYFNQIATRGIIWGLLTPLMPGAYVDNNPTMTQFAETFMGGTARSLTEVPASNFGYVDWLTHNFTTFWEVTVFGVTPTYPYTAILVTMAGLCGLSLVGLWRVYQKGNQTERWTLAILWLYFGLFIPLSFIQFSLSHRVNDAAQGRQILFPGGAAIAILLVWGWQNLVALRWRNHVALTIGALMLFWNGVNLSYLFDAFPPPIPVRTAFHRVPGLTFGKTLQFLGSDMQLNDRQNWLKLTLAWQALDFMAEDYRTEISFSRNGKIKRRWLSQPVNGRYPTRAWDKYDIVHDTLSIPMTGLEDGNYQIELRLLGADKSLNPKFVSLGEVTLTPKKHSFSRQLILKEAGLGGNVLSFDIWGNELNFLTGFQNLLALSSELPEYRYQATISLVAPPPDVADAGGKWRLKLIGPDGQAHSPDESLDQFYLFTVDHHWPSGNYRLHVEFWSDETLIATAESDPLLHVTNRQWQFTPPAMTHRTEANFANELMLLGYDLPMRRTQPSKGLEVILYWQALRQMRNDYVIFDHLLDATQKPWGGYDRLPRENYPTYLWVPDEIVTDGFIVPIDPHAPPGVYYLDVGLYSKQDKQARPLSLVKGSQSLKANSVTIGPLKIGGPPPGVTVKQANPKIAVKVRFGDIIELLGFDGDGATGVTLYWQAITSPNIDYTVFVHVRNQAGQVVAQYDRPPTDGLYPTSLWEVGEIIKDELDIPLENLPSGQYQIMIGLYDLATGQRLAVAGNSANELLLQTLNR